MLTTIEPMSTKPILQRWEELGRELGTDLYIVRDDLLPFPLAGNKVRKLQREFATMDAQIGTVITNGGIDSNHCRTTAWFARLSGRHAHLILHGDETKLSAAVALQFLRDLGATYEVVEPSRIATTIGNYERAHLKSGDAVHVISGGGHSLFGAQAFRDAGIDVLSQISADVIYVASGTGATQGGLVAAAGMVSPDTQVIGVSVAREQKRGVGPVREASEWAGYEPSRIIFRDSFRAGGYGKSDKTIIEAVSLGWEYGLPLDETYTGKAFAALLKDSRIGQLQSRTVFWHTGGLWNRISKAIDMAATLEF